MHAFTFDPPAFDPYRLPNFKEPQKHLLLRAPSDIEPYKLCNSRGAMEPLSDPFGDSEAPTPTPRPRDLGELPTRLTRAEESIEDTPRAFRATVASSPTSLRQNTPFRPLFASAAQQAPAKRGPTNPTIDNHHIDKTPRINTNFDGKYHQSQTFFQGSQNNKTSSQKLVLEARDLLVKAYSATKSREEQAKLLDLLEIFREYTEHNRVKNTSSILASQVANLERASKKIESQAKTTTWAKVATEANRQHPQPPNQVQSIAISSTDSGAKGNRARAPGSPRNPTETGANKPKGNSKSVTSKRCTLLQTHRVSTTEFSSINARNRINLAFKEKGFRDLVVSTVSLSLRGNIVLTTTPTFNVDFLIQNEAIIKGVLPLVYSLKKGEPWYKVAIHGIPITDFSTENGSLNSELVSEEIKTFNTGLTPVGNSYWVTPRDKRESGLVRTGTIIVAFPNENQAKRAISNRLLIGGISAKVVKFIATNSTTQCQKCAGFGHSELLCKREVQCTLCAENHTRKAHACNTCKSNARCSHTRIKCANCKENTHSADSKLCEIYLAIKNKATRPNTQYSSNSSYNDNGT
jgi:hypothetical protein